MSHTCLNPDLCLELHELSRSLLEIQGTLVALAFTVHAFLLPNIARETRRALVAFKGRTTAGANEYNQLGQLIHSILMKKIALFLFIILLTITIIIETYLLAESVLPVETVMFGQAMAFVATCVYLLLVQHRTLAI